LLQRQTVRRGNFFYRQRDETGFADLITSFRFVTWSWNETVSPSRTRQFPVFGLERHGHGGM